MEGEKTTQKQGVSGAAQAAPAAGGAAGAAQGKPNKVGLLAAATATLTAALGGRKGRAETNNATAAGDAAVGEGTGAGTGEQREGNDAAPPDAGDDAAQRQQQEQGRGALTLEELDRLVQERVDKALEETKQERSAWDMRERYIREKMPGLPPTIQNAMPMTADVQELQKAEQKLRGELVEWLRHEGHQVGYQPREVNGGQGTGDSYKPGAGPIPLTGSPTERLAKALEQEGGKAQPARDTPEQRVAAASHSSRPAGEDDRMQAVHQQAYQAGRQGLPFDLSRYPGAALSYEAGKKANGLMNKPHVSGGRK